MRLQLLFGRQGVCLCMYVCVCVCLCIYVYTHACVLSVYVVWMCVSMFYLPTYPILQVLFLWLNPDWYVCAYAHAWTQLSNFTFTFHFHALEKEMATHSSVLAWRIPGTGEPGGLPSMGSHRIGRDWSDLAVGSACFQLSGFIRLFPACVILGVQNLLLFSPLSVLFSKLAVFLFIWQSQEPVRFLWDSFY